MNLVILPQKVEINQDLSFLYSLSGKCLRQHVSKMCQNLRIKTDPVAAGADSMPYVRLCIQYTCQINQFYNHCICYTTATGSVLVRRFRLFLVHCVYTLLTKPEVYINGIIGYDLRKAEGQVQYQLVFFMLKKWKTRQYSQYCTVCTLIHCTVHVRNNNLLQEHTYFHCMIYDAIYAISFLL